MSIVKHLFALGILVSPLGAVADEPGAIETDTKGSVQVSFTNPDKYIDAAPHRGVSKARDENLRKIGAYMETLGKKYLKPDQTLKIEVLDIDLAGRVEWWVSDNPDLRVMRDIDSPSMKVRYSLEENGAVVSSGEEWMSDHTYLWGASAFNSGDSLRYEKNMLNDWFRNRFGKAQS